MFRPGELDGVETALVDRLDFLIAGVQKGGTTALWHFLRQHPNICFGSRKELHFFDDETRNWQAPNYDDLHRHFAPGDLGAGAVMGDATPIYTYWTPALERIYAYNRDIKLIVSLRHPAERAFSHWRMEILRNAETLSFSEAIRDGRKRMAEQAGRDGLHRVYSYVERGFYAEQLEKVFSMFARQQVLILKQTDLACRFGAVMDEICSFLDIGRFPTYPRREQVFSFAERLEDSFSEEDRSYLEAVFHDDMKALRDVYGIRFCRQ